MDEKKIGQPAAIAKTPIPSAAKIPDANGAVHAAASAVPASAAKPEISYGDFAKLDLRVARIDAAERVEGAAKLYKLTIDIAGEKRTLAAGIVQYYQPEELVGKSVIVISNLAPRTVRGILSQGMLLAAEDATGNICVLTTDKAMISGSKVR